MNVLYLNLKKKYFDQILHGTKKYEYREVKKFFIKRLQGKNYDFVKFSNGYSKNAPYFYVKYLGYEIVTRKFEITGQTIPCFKIKLGQVQKDLPF